MPQVTALQNEASELRARPAPEAAFTAKVAALEMDALLAAGKAWEAVLEVRSQKVFLSPYKTLSEDSRRDLQLGIRDIKQFTTAIHRRFRDSQNRTVSPAKETVARLLTSLDTVATLMREKLSK